MPNLALASELAQVIVCSHATSRVSVNDFLAARLGFGVKIVSARESVRVQFIDTIPFGGNDLLVGCRRNFVLS